jgi:hypothetical protein
MTALARASRNCKRQIHPLFREGVGEYGNLRVPYKKEISCLAERFLTSPERHLKYKKSWTGSQEATKVKYLFYVTEVLRKAILATIVTKF